MSHTQAMQCGHLEYIMKHRTEFSKGFDKVVANGCKLSVGDEPMTTAERFYCRIQDALCNHERAVFLAIYSRAGEPKAFLDFRILDGEVVLHSFSRLSQVWFADFIEKFGFGHATQTS